MPSAAVNDDPNERMDEGVVPVNEEMKLLVAALIEERDVSTFQR